DPQSGVKQRAIAVENLGEVNELDAIAQATDSLFSQLDSGLFIEIGNTIKPTGQSINTTQMTYAPRVILYTNKSYVSATQIMQAFSTANILIDIIDESEMHKSLFINYGGLDEDKVTKLNTLIK